MEGKLHVYHQQRNLVLFEYRSTSSTTGAETKTAGVTPNVLLFIGGMFDNFGIVPYVSDLAALFPRHETQQWSVMHVQLSSAMRQFGISDLNRDVDEIATAVTFIRRELRNNQPTNIVLMGHSTGCQDTLHYLHSPLLAKISPELLSKQGPDQNYLRKPSELRPPVQGAILQAAVSDRDMVLHMINTDQTFKSNYSKCVEMISKVPENEHRKTILPLHWTTPLFGPVPLSITRFQSLISPESPESPSDDDKFSHDLPPEVLAKTFGAIASTGVLQAAYSSSTESTASVSASTSSSPAKDESEKEPKTSILILLSGNDKYYPPNLSQNKEQFLTQWKNALDTSSSSSDQPTKEKQKEKQKVGLHSSSKIIPGGQHDLSGDSLRERVARLIYMRRSVLEYLSDVVVGGVDEGSWRIFRDDEERLNMGGEEREERGEEGEEVLVRSGNGSGDVKL